MKVTTVIKFFLVKELVNVVMKMFSHCMVIVNKIPKAIFPKEHFSENFVPHYDNSAQGFRKTSILFILIFNRKIYFGLIKNTLLSSDIFIVHIYLFFVFSVIFS